MTRSAQLQTHGRQFKSSAYAVFVPNDRTLYFIRSTDKVGRYDSRFGLSYGVHYSKGPCTIVSIDGKKYTGIVYSDIETATPKLESFEVMPWQRGANRIDGTYDIDKIIFVNTIRPLTTAYWFKGMYSTHSIEGLEHIDTRYVTDMTEMFAYCAFKGNIDVSKLKVNNVKSIRGMFHGCQDLRGINLTGWNTGNVVDMSGMFYDCGLVKIDISKLDIRHVQTAENMFNGCGALKAIKYNKEAVKAIPNKKNMFDRCEKLTEQGLYAI